MGVAVQKLSRNEGSSFEVAVKYYKMVCILNNLKVSRRNIELLAFTSLRGTITPLPARQEFAKMFHSSLASIENMKGSLHKKGLMVNVNGMYRVNPSISPDFSQERLILQIYLNVPNEKSEE